MPNVSRDRGGGTISEVQELDGGKPSVIWPVMEEGVAVKLPGGWNRKRAFYLLAGEPVCLFEQSGDKRYGGRDLAGGKARYVAQVLPGSEVWVVTGTCASNGIEPCSGECGYLGSFEEEAGDGQS